MFSFSTLSLQAKRHNEQTDKWRCLVGCSKILYYTVIGFNGNARQRAVCERGLMEPQCRSFALGRNVAPVGDVTCHLRYQMTSSPMLHFTLLQCMTSPFLSASGSVTFLPHYQVTLLGDVDVGLPLPDDVSSDVTCRLYYQLPSLLYDPAYTTYVTGNTTLPTKWPLPIW